MKPGPFDYYAPTSLAEALDTIAQLGYEGKVLAGGQSLIPAMNFRLANPTALVDINNIPELSYIRPAADGGLLIGAMTRDSKVEEDKLVAERFPIIPKVMSYLGHPQIRNRGTFGGNIAHADPTGHVPPMAVALNATLKLCKKDGERWVSAEEFIIGPFTSILEPDEMLVEVAIPPMTPHSGWSYQQIARQEGAEALIGVAVVVTLDDKNRCKEARIVFFNAGEVPMIAREAAKLLVGQQPNAEIISAAAEKAGSVDVEPSNDIHATAEYRRHLANVLARRALTEAFERAAKK